jgi:hypothetical protein
MEEERLKNQKPWKHLQIEEFKCKHKGIIIVVFNKVMHLKSMLSRTFDY